MEKFSLGSLNLLKTNYIKTNILVKHQQYVKETTMVSRSLKIILFIGIVFCTFTVCSRKKTVVLSSEILPDWEISVQSYETLKEISELIPPILILILTAMKALRKRLQIINGLWYNYS